MAAAWSRACWSSSTSIASSSPTATGSGLFESIPFIGKGLDVFESAWQVSDALVSTLLGILIFAGAVLAYVLPALPFIHPVNAHDRYM